MEILDLVDKLEAMSLQAKKMPITGRSMLDAERLLELIDQMRLAIPRNIQEAQEVIERREQIINQTMLDARRIRATAESDSRHLVEESELVKSAKKRGDELYAEAEQKAQRLLQAVETEARNRRAGADQYCQDVLEKLESEISKSLETIRTGQKVLGASSQSPAPDLLGSANGDRKALVH
ncbi:MAG: hypothetical protein WD533_06040 [Dehalococcoidia bacterium]